MSLLRRFAKFNKLHPDGSCYEEATEISLKCMADCPCGENCPTCESGQCSEFCPTTTTTTTTTTRQRPTTSPTSRGDSILIFSDDKVMLHNWPLGQRAQFQELQNHYNDNRSKFNLNGYWVKDTCSVQYKGESYLIGGSYTCTNSDHDCSHINVPRAVVKLSKSSCGLGQSWTTYQRSSLIAKLKEI